MRADDKLTVVPVRLSDANDVVRRWHRHHRPVVGCLFAVGVADCHGALRGAAIAGRPVSRHQDDGATVEVTRVATDGTRNACSMLLGAVRRAARALGYRRVITYTLPSEGGASLKAAGFRLDGEAGGPAHAWHSRPGRATAPIGDDLFGGKWRWVA